MEAIKLEPCRQRVLRTFWQYGTCIRYEVGLYNEWQFEGIWQERKWISVPKLEWSVACPNLISRTNLAATEPSISRLTLSSRFFAVCVWVRSGMHYYDFFFLFTSGQMRHDCSAYNIQRKKSFHPLVTICCLSLLHPWPAPAQYSLPPPPSSDTRR